MDHHCLLFLLTLFHIEYVYSQNNETLQSRLLFLNDGLDLFVPIRSILSSRLSRIGTDSVNRCYDPMINDENVDMFEPDITIFQVVLNYYKSLPDKLPTKRSIENLLESARTIAVHVINCSKMPTGYRLGFTSLSDKSFEEFQSMMGFNNDPLEVVDESANLTQSNVRRISCYPPSSYQAPSSINWITRGAVTRVRHQGQCGSCWAFAVIAALESAYLKKYGKGYDLSEQQLLDCAPNYVNGCESGTSYLAWKYIKWSGGVVSEQSYPYQAEFCGCSSQLGRIVARVPQYCVRGMNKYGNNGITITERLTESEMERAIAHFGPISVCMNGLLLQHYKGGVFNDLRCNSKITHMVLIVGYTKREWIIKNSWGKNWGENGFFRLARGKNLCGINFEMSYPII